MSFDSTGYTLAHEHLHIDLSGFKNNVDCRLDQYAFICQEMNDLMALGGPAVEPLLTQGIAGQSSSNTLLQRGDPQPGGLLF